MLAASDIPPAILGGRRVEEETYGTSRADHTLFSLSPFKGGSFPPYLQISHGRMRAFQSRGRNTPGVAHQP